MRIFRAIIIIAIAMCCGASAQISALDRFSATSYAPTATILPSSPTALVSTTVYIDAIILVNNSASAVTVRIRDISTNCSGGPCLIVPDDLTIAAKQMYSIPLWKIAATGGITWSASDGTAITGRVIGTK